MTNKSKILLLPLLIVALAAKAQHAAHVHGEAQLTIAAIENELHIEFESPGANLVGFEHEPHNPQEVRALETASQQLATPEVLLKFTGTDCQLHNTDVKAPHSKRGHKHSNHGHHEAHHDHSGHASFRVTYHYRCQNMDDLDSVYVTLFDRFPDIQKIDAQWLTAGQQGAATLTAQNNKLQLK